MEYYEGYEKFGFNNFILALGYKGFYIKDYFVNYSIRNSDIEIDIKTETLNIISEKMKTGKFH